MMKKYLLIVIIALLFCSPKAYALGGFSVSNEQITLNPGQSKTINISTNNAVGRLDINSSNANVASVSVGSVFIQTPGGSQSFTITAGSVGTTKINITASNNFATMDEEILSGQSKSITVDVINNASSNNQNTNNNSNAANTTVAPSNNNSNVPDSSSNSNVVPSTSSNNSFGVPISPNNNNTLPYNGNLNNKSSNNKIKELSVEGFELIMVDNTHYTLSVNPNTTSINIIATADDGKARIIGAGNHDIVDGETNIEVVVIAESGARNVISILVNKKDSYTVEDLDELLGDSTIIEPNITLTDDTVISKEDLEKIKNSGKTVTFNYYDENKTLLYSWIVDGNQLDNVNDLLTTISFNSDNKKDILKLSNYADGLFINTKQFKNIPKGIKIRIYVQDKYENNDLVNVYGYSNDTEKLDEVATKVKVKNGYIELNDNNYSDYLITMSNVGMNNKEDVVATSPKSNIIPILLIVVFIMIIIILIMIVKKAKKIKKVINNINNDDNAEIQIDLDDSNDIVYRG